MKMLTYYSKQGPNYIWWKKKNQKVLARKNIVYVWWVAEIARKHLPTTQDETRVCFDLADDNKKELAGGPPELKTCTQYDLSLLKDFIWQPFESMLQNLLYWLFWHKSLLKVCFFKTKINSIFMIWPIQELPI